MDQEEDNGLSTGVIIHPNGQKDFLTFWVKKWEMTVPSGWVLTTLSFRSELFTFVGFLTKASGKESDQFLVNGKDQLQQDFQLKNFPTLKYLKILITEFGWQRNRLCLLSSVRTRLMSREEQRTTYFLWCRKTMVGVWLVTLQTNWRGHQERQ